MNSVAGTTADQDPIADRLRVPKDAAFTLMVQCRRYIREHMMRVSKVNLFYRIPRLQLPRPVTAFLLHDVELEPPPPQQQQQQQQQ